MMVRSIALTSAPLAMTRYPSPPSHLNEASSPNPPAQLGAQGLPPSLIPDCNLNSKPAV